MNFHRDIYRRAKTERRGIEECCGREGNRSSWLDLLNCHLFAYVTIEKKSICYFIVHSSSLFFFLLLYDNLESCLNVRLYDFTRNIWESVLRQMHRESFYFKISLWRFQTIYRKSNSRSSAQSRATQRVDISYHGGHSGIASGPVTLTRGKRIGAIIRWISLPEKRSKEKKKREREETEEEINILPTVAAAKW